MRYGYNGTVLHVNLSKGTFEIGKPAVDPIVLLDAISFYYDVNGWDERRKPARGKLVDLGLEWLLV